MYYFSVKMKNLKVLWIFGYTFLLVKNWSIVNACDTDEYEGALCFNKEAIRRLAPSIEAQFYDEATGIFSKVRTLFLFNFRDHFYKLVGDRLLRLCKCMYKKMTEDYDYLIGKEDAAFKDFGYTLIIKKKDPGFFEFDTIHIQSTLIDCYINELAFTLVEGYKARFCRNCYDIYLIFYDSLNKPGVRTKRVDRIINGNPQFKFISKVNRVDFNTI